MTSIATLEKGDRHILLRRLRTTIAAMVPGQSPHQAMNAAEETNITEIELLPDGRICVFGTSLEVLEVLDELQCSAGRSISERLDSLRQAADDEPRGEPAMLAEECDA